MKNSPCPILKMSVNEVSIIVGCTSSFILGITDCKWSYTNYWLPVYVQQIVKHSLPYLEYVRQSRVNNCWPSVIVNHSAMWPLWSIYMILTSVVC
jgi:hypothetical protein